MGWQDAPVASAAPAAPAAAQPAWASAPLADQPPTAPVDPMAAHRARLAQVQQELKDAQDNAPGFFKKAMDLYGGYTKGVLDTAASIGSQIVGQPLAGGAGIVRGATNLVEQGLGLPQGRPAADVVGDWSKALTYQPQSDVGKRTAAMIAKPVGYVVGKADQAGEAVSNATGSPLAGTAVTTALQGLPIVAAPEVRGAFSSVARAAMGRGTIAAPAAAAATAAPAATPATVAAAAAKAKGYAGSIGLDWDALADGLKAKLTGIAQSAGALENLDPAAVAREAKLQSLPVPVPATAGQLARDPVALRNEGNIAATASGQPIRDVHLAANKALLDNLDVLKGKVTGTGETAATATTPEQVGASVQGAARGKLELAKAQVKSLYKAADEAGETAVKVDTQPILDMIEKTPDQSHYGYAKAWLKGNTDGPLSGTSIRDLEDLRKAAVAKAMNGGEDGFYAGKLIDAIDTATEGGGGELYAKARAARKAQALEFQDQGAVADLVDNASRTDRTTALENTTKTITSGSLEDVRNIKRTLLTGGDDTTRTAGRQAWRDVRAQVIQQIKDDATKSVAPNADGSANLTPSALKGAIDRLGPQKLDEIFGPGTTRQIYSVLDAAQTVKTVPSIAPGVGSSTLQNVLTFLEKGISKVPVVGPVSIGGVKQLYAAGTAGAKAEAATVTPLNEALAGATARANAAARRRQIGGAAQAIPLSTLGRSPNP